MSRLLELQVVKLHVGYDFSHSFLTVDELRYLLL